MILWRSLDRTDSAGKRQRTNLAPSRSRKFLQGSGGVPEFHAKGLARPAAILTLLAVLLATLPGCGRDEASSKKRPPSAGAPARSVRVIRAASRPMERTLHIVGTLRAQEDATVAAQVAGQMEETRVDVGDRVTAGREMALIDTTTYQALARQSAANLAKALASAANAEQNLKRIQSLQNDKIASASEFDEAAAAAGQARAEVEAAKAADALVQLNLARSRVKAPFDGTVAERIASIGDYVAIGTPILRLVKTDPLRLRLEVPERESISVRVDQAVRLRVEGDTNVYAGRIARLSPALSEDNRMLLAEADVPNRGSLRPGLFARAEIVVNEREDGLSVPAHALITFAGIDKVVVVKDGKALEKTVTIGRRGSDWVEIVAGLAAGEAVVLEPVGLRSGQPVTVTDPTEPSKPTPAAAGSG